MDAVGKWDEKNRAGKFRPSPRCDGCGKPVGKTYLTDDEVCGLGDGPGFYICTRARCASRLDRLTVEQRREIYTAQRALR
jgi:hypothetical protein